MNTLAKFGTLAAALVLTGSLAVTAIQPAAAGTTTLNQYDYWSSVVDRSGDTPVCGVRTHMQDGAELRLLVIGGEVHLVAHDPGWDMRADQETRVRIVVDDQGYAGTAQAIDPETLVVASLTDDFLRDFVAGSRMVAEFGGVRWSVDLTGSGRATSDMVDCVAAARRIRMM